MRQKVLIALSFIIYHLSFSPASAAEPDTLGYNKFRFGGYGEMVANFKDYGINRFYGHSEGNAKQNHNNLNMEVLARPTNWRIPRTVNTRQKWRKAVKWHWSSFTSQG